MSGSLIGGVVGAVIGSFIPGVGPQLGWMIGSAVGGLVAPGPNVEGPRLSDLRPQGSEYGREIPVVYGTIAVGGNVIWASEYEEVAGEEGGKGGGGGVTTYSYYGNFAVLICESNGDVELGRIWAGPEKRLIYDGVTLEGGGSITYYNGAAGQLPDPLMESYLGVGNVPAYRGYAVVVFDSFPLSNDGNMLPFLTIEVGSVATVENIGVSYSMGEIFTDVTGGTYHVSYYAGTTSGVVTRNLADNSYVSHHHWATAAGQTNSFYDADRDVIVYIDSASMFKVDIGNAGATASLTVASTWPGLPNTGYRPVGGVYHNGYYHILMHHTTSGVGISVLDPNNWTTSIAFYSGDAGFTALGLADFCAHRQDGDSYILGATKAGTVRKFPLSNGFTSTSCGASVANPEAVAVDPNTGYVWSGSFDAGDLTVAVNDPVTQSQLYAAVLATEAFNWTATSGPTRGFPWVFGNGKVVAVMEKWLATDYFVEFTAATPAFSVMYPGRYVGSRRLQTGFYNTVTSEYWFLRFYAWMNTAIAGSLANIAEWGYDNDSYPGSGVYLGDTGLTVQGEPLGDVVADLFVRAGLQASEYDVSALASDTVDGYAVARQTAVREAVSVLSQAYFFDIVERNGQLVCVKRGGAIAATIPDEDLGAYEDGGEPEGDLLLTTRQMENELPKTLTVSYINRNSDYNAMTRRAERLIGDGGDEQSADFPLVLTDTDAQGAADTMLHQAWVQRRSYRFSLPIKYIYLEPTDLVSIRNQTMMVTRVNHKGGVLQCDGFFDDYNYVPNVVVTETPTTGKIVYVPSATAVELMDVNMAADTDDSTQPFFYVAAAGYDADTWDGAVLYVSSDGGANYISVATVTAAATMGYADDALGNFTGGNIVDELSRVTVVMLNGTLSSTDAAGLLAGTNQALIGNEWVFFRDATLTATNTYVLSGFLRGRRGTEHEIGNHAAADRFVLWNSAVQRVSQVTADLEVTKLYKAVSAGQTIASVEAEEFTLTGKAIKPYSPVHLGGGRDASNNVTINWTRRNRTSGEWRDSVDVPMTEASEAYSVDIYSNSGYTTVVRTISATSATASYSAAAQTSDGLTPGATVYFKVYQIGGVIGRGHVATGSV